MNRPREYIIVIQDSRGYPGNRGQLDPAPPDGPEPAMLRSVVLVDDYDHLKERYENLRRLIDRAMPVLAGTSMGNNIIRELQVMEGIGDGRTDSD